MRAKHDNMVWAHSSVEADDEHTFAVLGQTVLGGVQHTMAYVVDASPDGAQPSQNHTQCFWVVSR